MWVVRTILIGGVVGGTVMAIAFLLLPDTPVYDALSIAVGGTAGFLTWKPAGQPTRRHLAGCAAAFVMTFAAAWGIERIL
jgi:hypothetical protein